MCNLVNNLGNIFVKHQVQSKTIFLMVTGNIT